MTKKQILIIDAKDNVGILVGDVPKGKRILLDNGTDFEAIEDIPKFHKVAITDIEENDPIIRYSEKIGYATRRIQRGEWVHIHNLDAYDIMR